MCSDNVYRCYMLSKAYQKKTSKLTVTSKLRSSEGDWKLERKDCPTCPACPSVHPCLRPSLPGGSITNLSQVSECFLDFLLFCRITQISHWLHTGKQRYWWQRWRQWWRWCGWGSCRCCSPFAAGNHVWRGSYCGLWWASPFCSMFLLILTLLNKIITFLLSVLLESWWRCHERSAPNVRVWL